MKRAAPPGWQPHKIITRIDGWLVGQGQNPVPASVSEMIAHDKPQRLNKLAVAAIRARMLARHKKVLGNV